MPLNQAFSVCFQEIECKIEFNFRKLVGMLAHWHFPAHHLSGWTVMAGGGRCHCQGVPVFYLPAPTLKRAITLQMKQSAVLYVSKVRFPHLRNGKGRGEPGWLPPALQTAPGGIFQPSWVRALNGGFFPGLTVNPTGCESVPCSAGWVLMCREISGCK